MSGDSLQKTVQAYLAAEMYANQAEHGSAERQRRDAELEAARRRLKEELARSSVNAHEAGIVPCPSHVAFDRILVAVDSSPQSALAVDLAVQFARQFSSQIGLVHVVPAPAVVGPEVPATEADIRIQLHHEGEELLVTTESRLPSDLSRRVATFLREGNAVEEIVGVAHRWDANLLVMGTRGRGRLGQFLLGSVAAAVISRSPCPVLTVAHAPVVATTAKEPALESVVA